jgi:peptidylprolyl isomerase
MPLMQRSLLIILGLLAVIAIGCGGASSGATSAEGSGAATREEGGTNEQADFEAPAGSTIEVPAGAPPKKLVIKELKKGNGATAKPGDEVKLQYVEALYSTGEVTSVAKRYAPFHLQLPARGGIRGWEKGIVGMKVGERRELIIPSDLTEGQASLKGSAAVFFVDLVGIG